MNFNFYTMAYYKNECLRMYFVFRFCKHISGNLVFINMIPTLCSVGLLWYYWTVFSSLVMMIRLSVAWLGSRFVANEQIVFFNTPAWLALVSTQPPVQLILGIISLRVKWPGYEHDFVSSSSAEVENICSCTFVPLYLLMVWCWIKHRYILMMLNLTQEKLLFVLLENLPCA
jgi:hypothetical protein